MATDNRDFLLIAGGSGDPQLKHLIARAQVRNIPIRPLLHDPVANPAIAWDLDAGEMRIEGEVVHPRAAFIRQDVFRHLQSGRQIDSMDAMQWKAAIDGWIISTPAIRRFNRGFMMREAVNKPLALIWARECGLRVPKTLVGNAMDAAMAFCEARLAIYKPAAGGDLCRELTVETLEKARSENLQRPYIMQEQLNQPEHRVFYVGGEFVTFHVDSKVLDYREDGNRPSLKPVDTPAQVKEGLGKLAERLGLDYSAADFKACPETGEPVFLEINSNPMFAAFDTAAEGALADAMLDWLMQ